ncbi:MAG TPA: uracil-DNA glycosylase [Gammaproteobacteria bacterium]|nr:uracil-DNA glycosylase [Gammaproteobacteria bacterium]
MTEESHRRLSTHQLACLQAMGIDVWLPRGVSADAPRPGGDVEQATVPGVPAAGGPVSGLGSDSVQPAAQTSDAATGADSADISWADWDALRGAVMHCTRCPLHETRSQGVFGVGDTRARLMVIGEAPGADEDRLGEPFVGRAGKLLDAMLHAIGEARGDGVYITNILKSRPPNNRDPRPEEVAACEPFLRRQIELIEPDVILAVGRVAAQNLLKTDQPLGRLRGRWHSYGPRQTPVWVTYHPAYLLRKPVDKRKAWQDLKTVRGRIAEAHGKE